MLVPTFAAVAAVAAPINYATSKLNIRAGVVILDSAKPATLSALQHGLSAAPFALLNLDRAYSVKPINWNIYNPFAPGSVTQAMIDRWTLINTQIPTDIPVLGATISKVNAEYWSVYLDDVSDQVLSNYNLLVVNPMAYAQLNTAECEKLLKFVDQGGTLWIDPAGFGVSSLSTQDIFDNFPLAFSVVGVSGGTYSNPFDPLLTFPEPISPSDLNLLHQYYQLGVAPVSTGVSDPGGWFTPLASEFSRFRTVTAVGTPPTIAVAHIGNGAIVLTPTGVSQILNRDSGLGIGKNLSYTASPTALESDGVAAAKLAVNMIYEMGDYPQPAGGSRKSGGDAVDVTAPVLTRWKAEGNTVYGNSLATIAKNTPPVLYKGVYVATTGNCLTVFKARPGTDLDGDGDPDDGLGAGGLRDYSVGYPYDVIWVSPTLLPPLSAPVCVEVPDAQGGLPVDQVLVVDGNGALHVFALFNKAGGQLTGGIGLPNHGELYNLTPPMASGGYALPPAVGTNPAVPNPPTVTDNLAFISDAVTYASPNPTGRVWVVDLTTGQYLSSNPGGPWYVGGTILATAQFPGYTAACTVGYIPIQDGSGGMDRVIYGPGVISGNFAPGFNSIWLGAKGEAPFDVTPPSGGQITITTRAASQGNLPVYDPPVVGSSPAQLDLAPKLTLLDSNGNPIAPGSVTWNNIGPKALVNMGGGVLQLSYTCTDAQFMGWVSGERVDYTIDWGMDPSATSVSLERGRVQLPIPPTAGGGAPGEMILGSIALTPAGTLCMTVSHNTAPGSLYWFKEDAGRGAFRMTGRFSLYNAHTILMNGGTTTPWPATMTNEDPLISVLGANFSKSLSGFSWAGPPVVVGNQVYALANAFTTYAGSPVVPATVVMAFAAEPPTPELRTVNMPVGFQLMQPDFERSTNQQIPDSQSSLSMGSFTYDASTGIIQIPNLCTITRGQITDSLSLSQPVIVRAGGIPDTVLDPNLVGDTWTPMQWYSVFIGDTVHNAPLVTGGTLFFAGDSNVPSLLSTGSLTPIKGIVGAMDAVIPLSDTTDLSHPSDRPYMNQVNQIDAAGGTFAQPDPHILMPSARGANSFLGYLARLNQTVLGNSGIGSGIIGGGDTVAAWGDQGLYGLGRADFLVCDQGRLVRVDSSGNALYSSNSNVNSGPGGGGYVANVTQLVRPTRAYPLSQGEMLVVDTGGNRVLKLDNSGLEERAIDKFITDPIYKPAGFQANEPLNLSGPRDAITYAGYVTPASLGVTISNPQTQEYWVHYLVADSGHKRLVELIDRFQVDSSGRIGGLVTVNMPDPNVTPSAGNNIPTRAIPQAGVLWWQSPASVSGKNFDYNSVTRIFLNSVSSTGRYVYIAGIGSSQPSRTDVGLDNPALGGIRESATGNGGVVVFDPEAQNGIQIYDVWDRPDLTQTPFWDANAGVFDTSTPASAPAQGRRPISGVTAVTAKAIQDNTGKSVAQIMVSCADGVFEAVVDPTTTSDEFSNIDWYMSNAAFTGIWTPATSATIATQAGSQLRPGYARRLDSGEIMLVNSYTGTTLAGNPYKGEVLLLDGTTMTFPNVNRDLGLGLSSIHFYLPSISGARDLTAPIFADRR